MAAARSSSTSAGGLDRGVALGERVERARQPDQALGLLVQRLVGRAVGRDDAVAQRLEVALQVGQRRPQLVGGVGDEVAAHLLLPLERGGHLVERVGEAGQLLGALARDARRVVAVGDRAGPRRRPRRAGWRASAPSTIARPTLASDRHDDAAMTTVVTESSYISWACSAESPASTIRAVKTSAPTTATPTARITSPTAAAGDRREGDPTGDPADDHDAGARAAR